MSFWSTLAAGNNRYSSDPEVREMQEKAEQLKIYDMIKIVANHGDDTKDEPNILEWEECTLNYNQNDSTKLTMKDGTLLYLSEKRIVDLKRVEYINAFRNGKWVDRLKAYSEKLTQDHKQSLIAKANEEKERKLKPFTDIDF
ncbi:MAG: hypothetical protein E7I55_05795 [Acinetobacter ursingii]|nr:hypothetical protein [Acinetobacter ursingii]